MSEPVPFRLGDLVILRKPHPCGGSEWEVVRVGMDIGIVCQTCGHRVTLVRRELEHRLRARAPAQRPGAPPA